MGDVKVRAIWLQEDPYGAGVRGGCLSEQRPGADGGVCAEHTSGSWPGKE